MMLASAGILGGGVALFTSGRKGIRKIEDRYIAEQPLMRFNVGVGAGSVTVAGSF